jgi:hypothetical protein
VLSFPYMDDPEGGNQATPKPETGEYVTLADGYYYGSRVGFDDTGDFNLYVASPLSNRFGVELGKDAYNSAGQRLEVAHVQNDLFDTWYALIQVKYADPNDLSQDLSSGTSDYRSANVIIFDSVGDTDREIYRIRRVYSFLGQ